MAYRKILSMAMDAASYVSRCSKPMEGPQGYVVSICMVCYSSLLRLFVFSSKVWYTQGKHTSLLSQSKFAIGATAIKTLWSQRKVSRRKN